MTFLPLRTCFAVALAALVVAAPAAAQDNQVQALVEQIQRLRADLDTLQRDYYRGAPPAARGAQAADPAGDRRQAEQAAQFEVRLNSLEGEIRALTGSVERFGHVADQNRAQLERMAADLDLRLQAIEQAVGVGNLPRALGAAGAAAGAPPLAGPAGAASPVAAEAAPASPPSQQAAAPPGFQGPQQPVPVPLGGEPSAAGAQVLGVLPADEPGAPLERGPGGLPQAPPAGTPQEQYEIAYGFLQQFRIAEAEQAFREFLGANPDHALAANARYWLGETFYGRQMYQEAALTFFEAYQAAPGGNKAPDNLLKLGMSLARMDQTTEACATLAELAERFPDAVTAVRDQAAAERRRLGCP